MRCRVLKEVFVTCHSTLSKVVTYIYIAYTAIQSSVVAITHDGDNHAAPKAQSNLLNESCIGRRTHNYVNAWKSSYSI